MSTTNEADICGVDADAQLTQAAERSAAIVTNNTCEYTALHSRWFAEGRAHAGIVLFPQQGYSIGEVVLRLPPLRSSFSAEEMMSRLEWLSTWCPIKFAPHG